MLRRTRRIKVVATEQELDRHCESCLRLSFRVEQAEAEAFIDNERIKQRSELNSKRCSYKNVAIWLDRVHDLTSKRQSAVPDPILVRQKAPLTSGI